MDDNTRVLKLLADRPQDAVGLCSQLGISPNMLFTLLRKMEKEDLIVWNGEEWAVRPSSDSKQSDLPDTCHPSEGGSNA